MCITWCHQRQILYWNHDNCHPFDCPKANEKHGRCENCRHRLEGEDRLLCSLTRAPLPQAGGCCHYNVKLIAGPQKVTLAVVEMLGPGSNETVRDVLDGFDVAHQIDGQGDVWVDSDELGLPDIYGRGADEL